MPPAESIALAHGIRADGSCFSKLIPALQAERDEAIASEHGLDGPAATSAVSFERSGDSIEAATLEKRS
ncbi:MAG: hypothetical protein WAM97_12355 [Acidimicrobiales bacterium]|jgi:hypothetical protein